MSTPSQGRTRLVRAGAAAAAVLVPGIAAHRAAGGDLPGVLPLALLLALVTWASLLAGRWRLSRTGAVVLLALGQYAVHHLLALTAAWSAPRVSAGGSACADATAGSASAHHVGALACAGSGGAAHPAAHSAAEHASSSSSAAMTVAHVGATVLAALLVSRGERLLAAVRTRLRPLVALPAVVHGPVEARPRAAADAPALTPLGVVVLTGRPRRGPPAGPCSALPAPA